MNNEKGLTSNAIKIIAIIAMTVDHTATIFFPRYSLDVPVLLMHIIGRLTAPIMMFFIVEGYHYILCWAFIYPWNYQNIFIA